MFKMLKNKCYKYPKVRLNLIFPVFEYSNSSIAQNPKSKEWFGSLLDDYVNTIILL